MIEPHGKILVNQRATEFIDKNYPKIILNKPQIDEVINICNGVFSPLKGFLRKDDFEKVITQMRLTDGTVWPIPIVLDVTKEQVELLKQYIKVLLVDSNSNPIAILQNFEIFSWNKKFFVTNVYGTDDKNHPGVAYTFQMKDFLIGGELLLINKVNTKFSEYIFTPQKTRTMFRNRGWQTVVAFQTRNIPHLGHEFLQKKALEKVDGLFIQPVIGEKKHNDFKDEYILGSYEILIDNYFPKNKVVLGVLPLKMRYAGPREALLHAIIRQNYGCTHFIIGRDHAGVGNYYYPLAAQEIFNQFNDNEIKIKILKFPEVVFDKMNKKHCFIDQCPKENQIGFSGTILRNQIKSNQQPPNYLIRKQVYNFLTSSKNTFVDSMYNKQEKNNKGFVLWLTGLSQSGKSTIADKVFEILKNQNCKVERLDGDVVRESLTKDLGFSKDDRDENIRRIGFVCKLLSRNGVGVIASFISPYKQQREEIKIKVENYIEVFVNTPLEICEQRDKKGLYQKARLGEIKNFTGISDPYEKPENPDIELSTENQNSDQCAGQIVDYLKNQGLVDPKNL